MPLIPLRARLRNVCERYPGSVSRCLLAELARQLLSKQSTSKIWAVDRLPAINPPAANGDVRKAPKDVLKLQASLYAGPG